MGERVQNGTAEEFFARGMKIEQISLMADSRQALRRLPPIRHLTLSLLSGARKTKHSKCTYLHRCGSHFISHRTSLYGSKIKLPTPCIYAHFEGLDFGVEMLFTAW